jgi:uncharacterized lipoprotein YmbA
MKRPLSLIALLVLAACGTSPEPAYYELTPAGGVALPDVAETVEIQRPLLPAYLDRPEMVADMGGGRIKIDEMRRWGEPLDEMLERVLAENVRQRLPNSAVMAEGGDRPVKARFTVMLDLQKFNQSGDSTALLSGQMMLRDTCILSPRPQPQPQPVRARAKPVRPGAATGGIEGMSSVVSKLADQIAFALRAQSMAVSCGRAKDKPKPEALGSDAPIPDLRSPNAQLPAPNSYPDLNPNDQRTYK